MSDNTHFVKWLRLEAERPDYVSEADRMMFSGAADALEQAQDKIKTLKSKPTYRIRQDQFERFEGALQQISDTAEFPSDEAHQDCVDIAKETLTVIGNDNDKELADKVLLVMDSPPDGLPEEIIYQQGLPPELFVRDWRVAGVMLEKQNTRIQIDNAGDKGYLVETYPIVARKFSINKSLPRAIIEACVEALT